MRRSSILPALFLVLMTVSSRAAVTDRVILVSVDGLRADLLENLLANDLVGDFSNFERIVDEGASTFNARTDYFYTNTLPNHTTMMTGRPVLQPAGEPLTVHHGYTSNGTPGPDDTLHNMGNPFVAYVAGVFDVAFYNGLSTALYASKSKFVIYDQSWTTIDTYVQASTGSPANASTMHTALVADLIAAPADFTFVHYRDPDSAGHAYGWGSTSWNQAVASVDDYLGDIFDLVDAGKLGGSVVLIITSDHGGSGTGHGDETIPAVYTIPFLAWGTGVAAGTDLYALNAGTRTDPGLGRPDYVVTGQPIRNGDAGNLALDLLGLGPIPGSSINASQDLAVDSPLSTVAAAPGTFDLNLFPNPANPAATVAFTLGEPSPVRVGVYDPAGRRVAVLADRRFPAGRNAVPLRNRSLGSGIYLVKVETPRSVETGKLMLVK